LVHIQANVRLNQDLEKSWINPLQTPKYMLFI